MKQMNVNKNEKGRYGKPDFPAAANGNKKLQLKIGGMSCSFCVASITKGLSGMAGVHRVHVNLAHEETLIEYDPNRVTPAHLEKTLIELGYTVRDADKLRTFEEEEAELRQQRGDLVTSGFFTVVSFIAMLFMWLDVMPAWGMAALFWLMPILAFSTIFGPGWHILNMAWASIRRGILNQHVLLELAAFAALAGGFLGYLSPAFPLPDFFGVAVFVTTYHILSGYVSLHVRTRASQAVRKLLALVPPIAHVLREGREEDLLVELVRKDDLVRVRPGESLPVDGEVVDGASGVDESLVSGESIPQEKRPGDTVIGGSLNQSGTLVIRVTKVGEESFLNQIARHIEEARALKPSILALVDRVLLVYVPGVLGFAAAAILIWTLGAWLTTGTFEWSRGIFAVLAVLVMGYPCALGMATPLAMIRGGGMAAERGILMRSAEAFQVLKDVRRIIFDKTGTLTRGEPSVAGVTALGKYDQDEVLRLAAAVESASEHPLARAVVEAARSRGLLLPKAGNFESSAGRGVKANIEGHRVVLGNLRFIGAEGVNPGPAGRVVESLQDAGNTVVVLGVDRNPAGVIAIADRLKDDAREAVARLREAKLEPVMLTGDNPRTARAVAETLGIAEYRAEVLPQEKAAAVRDLQAQGYRVAMVGDGINDAPALMQADVGIAIGAGTDIAIESADIVLIGERLNAVVDAYQIGRLSYRKTVQNLTLAFLFNGIGVPLAVTGLVHPVWAMIAMAGSVSTVLLNSFAGRLLRVKSLPVRQERPVQLTLRIANMHCQHCLDSIGEGLSGLAGVERVTGDPAAKSITVTYRKGAVEPDGIRTALLERGFRPA